MMENNKVRKKSKLFDAKALNKTSPASTKNLNPTQSGDLLEELPPPRARLDYSPNALPH